MAEDKQAPAGEQQPPQLTNIEQKALDAGWVPQDQWDGEPDAWRPAKEFLDRGELFKKIDDQGRVIKDLRKTQQDLVKHYEKVREVEYRRAVEELKRQKKEALGEGDVVKVMEIDEQIEAKREEIVNLPPPQVPDISPTVNPVFEAWVNRNSWYQHDDVMQAYADKVGLKLGQSGMSPTDLLTEVERQVKTKFADKFENSRRKAPPAVEGGGARGGRPTKDTFQMSDDERRVMQRFIRQIPGMTEDKYIADLKKIKGVS